MGSKRTFASALDWPGWTRAGKGEAAAIEALSAAAPRYRCAIAAAGIALPVGAEQRLEVVERTPGDATTDFGAPGRPAAADQQPLSTAELDRLLNLVRACWAALDGAVAVAPPELRKGPRGGGRDRDSIAEHVLSAEAAYGGKLGVRLKQPPYSDRPAVVAFREAILGGLRGSAAGWSPGDRGWPARYAARRYAWHALDHAWEIEDRTV